MGKRDQAAIEFVHVNYNLVSEALLRDLNLSVKSGETLVLLGRSGSGKTTSLKLINRLLVPTSGEVSIEGVPTTQWDPIKLRRRIGYAIQEIGLFPHYTVEQNISLLPKLEHWPAARITGRISELLELVGLAPAEFRDRYPDELSGGQRQRVGLARALVLDPPILLMDEPFGALDPLTRSEIQSEFKRIASSLAKTVVFVTHDTAEALLLGTRIAVIDSGDVKGIFTPTEFRCSNHPAIQPYLNALRITQHAMEA